MRQETARRKYLREATLFLFLARFATRLLPPSAIIKFANRPPRYVNRFSRREIEWIIWAVQRKIETRSRTVSLLEKSIAIKLMLRRRGIINGPHIAYCSNPQSGLWRSR